RKVLMPQTEWGHFGPLEQPERVADEVFHALAPGECRSVIVTGASTGLGLETALQLAAAGFVVYATVRDLAMAADVKAAAAERGVNLRVLRLDLTEPDSIAAAVASVVAETGGVFG